MIKRFFIKNLAVATSMVAILTCGVNASASFQSSNVVWVIPEGSDMWDRLFRRNNNANMAPGVTVSQQTSNNDVFRERYARLVDRPLYNLLRSFTDRVGFERNESYATHVYVFNGNDQAIAFAQRLNGLMNRVDENLAGKYISALRSSTNINDSSFQLYTVEMEAVNREVTQLARSLNEIPENRPTEEDYNAGRCVDSGLDDH